MKIELQNCAGFSLIEVVIAIGIASILLAIVTLNFHGMGEKYNVEAQVKQMQADLDNVRLKAMTTKKSYALVLNRSSYAFVSYSSEGDLPGTPAGPPVQVKYPMQRFSAGSYSDFGATTFTIDSRGCLTSGAPLYIAVAPGVTGPAVNALAVQTAKTNVGIIQGANCVLQ